MTLHEVLYALAEMREAGAITPREASELAGEAMLWWDLPGVACEVVTLCLAWVWDCRWDVEAAGYDRDEWSVPDDHGEGLVVGYGDLWCGWPGWEMAHGQWDLDENGPPWGPWGPHTYPRDPARMRGWELPESGPCPCTTEQEWVHTYRPDRWVNVLAERGEIPF